MSDSDFLHPPLEVTAVPPGQKIVRPYALPQLRPGEFYVEPVDPASLGSGPVYCIEDSDQFDYYAYRVRAMVYAGKTRHQNVVIADTYNYGRTLFMDGSVQSSADDESLYHEMLAQPAMLAHENPRNVLIIGAGEGAAVREVLAHKSVRHVTMVDIDREAVEICREFLPAWHQGAFEDHRAHLVFEDGRRFVEATDDRYDVVLVDVVDMFDNGPAQDLYTRQFYELLRTRLRPNGIVGIQGLEFSFQDYKEHVAVARTLRTVFPQVHSYRVAIPSFLGTWGFFLASDWASPKTWQPELIDRQIENRLGNDWMDNLTGEFLISSFVHCKETNHFLAQSGPILEDGVPFVPPPDIEDVEPSHAKLPALD